MELKDLLDCQRALQEKYKDKWGGVHPARGKEQLLWMYGEMAEVGDILKKQGCDAIVNDPETRQHFVEEMCDVLMYFGDMLLCYDVSAEELEAEFLRKFERNMRRW